MKGFTEYMLENSFVCGIGAIMLSILLLLYTFFKESSKMKNHDIMSWKAYVNTWAFAIMLMMLGIFLLLR
jgi:hypothetical protein